MGALAAETQAGQNNRNGSSEPAHVVIVGAGPAGLILAFYLLEWGNGAFKISIYESREDLRTTAKRALNARRYSLSLAYKGKTVCKPIPGLLDAIKKISRPMDQLHLHVGSYVGTKALNLDLVPAGPDREDRVGLNLDRANLCAVMYDKLLERHGNSGLLEVHFFKRCAGVDFRNHEVSFEDVALNVEAEEGDKGLDIDVIPGQDTKRTASGAKVQKVPYDLIVGADGVNSMVRHTMTLEPRGFDCSVVDQFTGFYILNVPRPPNISPTGFNIVPSCPDSASFRCVFYPNGDDGGSLNLAIGWANDNPPHDFLALTDPQEVTKWLQKRLPFLIIPEECGKSILSQRIGNLRQVHCEPYHMSDARAVLVGDAAHATSPSIGQGCNSSMVDAAVLARLLLGQVVGEDDRLGNKGKSVVGEDDRSGNKGKKSSAAVSDVTGTSADVSVSGREELLAQLPKMLERYSALQVREGHALVDLSESESPMDQSVAFWHQLRTMTLGFLSRFLPWFFPKPVLFMVASDMSFSEMRKIHEKEVEKVLASNMRLKADWRRTEAQKVLDSTA